MSNSPLYLVQTHFSLDATPEDNQIELIQANVNGRDFSVLDSCLESIEESAYFDGRDGVVTYGHTSLDGVDNYRPDNPFRRDFQSIAENKPCDFIVRLPGNSPKIHPGVMDRLIEEHVESDSEYTFTTDLPKGLGPLEIVDRDTLISRTDAGSYDDASIHIFTSIRQAPSVKQCEVSFPEWESSGISMSIYSERELDSVRSFYQSIEQEGFEPLKDTEPERDFPHFVQVEPTNRCNLECGFCSRDSLMNFGDMTFDQFKQFIDENPGIKRMSMNGDGEPMLNQDIGRMIEYASEQGIGLRMVTNGLLLNEKRAELLNEHLDVLLISLDSAEAETFEEIRGVDGLEQLKKNIRTMTRVKRNQPGKLQLISVNCVCSALAIPEVPDLIRMSEEMDVDNLNLKLMNTNYSKGAEDVDEDIKDRMDNLVPDLDMLERLIHENKEMIRDAEIKVEFDIDIEKGFTFQKCAQKKRCYVTWSGHVTPCCLRNNPEVINFGNVFEESLEEIWNSEQYRAFRKDLLNGEPGKLCQTCPRIETSTLLQEMEIDEMEQAV